MPQYRNRILELVEKDVSEALPLLAHYRNEADTSIFINCLLDDEFSNRGRTLAHYSRKAILNFPHPSFYLVLRKLLLAEVGTNGISDSYESDPLYEALVQYPTKETNDLLDSSLSISGSEDWQRARAIKKAVEKYPSKVFDELLKNLKDK